MNYNSLEEEFSDYHKLKTLIDEYENMVTTSDIQAGIVGVNQLTDLVKKAIILAEKTNNVEIKETITELRDQLANTKNLLIDTKEELINLKVKNQQLKKENRKLKSPEWQLIFDIDKDAYYQKNDVNKKKPYCSYCWDNKLEKSGLTKKDNYKDCLDFGYPTHYCPSCKRQNEYL